MRRFLQLLCTLFGHGLLGGQIMWVDDSSPTAEDAHWKCNWCGKTWDFYF